MKISNIKLFFTYLDLLLVKLKKVISNIYHVPFKSNQKLIIFFLFSMLVLLSCTNPTNDNKERYVVLSPEIAEILAYLGISDRIVGITAECDYPLELQNIEIVGNFGQFSLERILALNPSIVFTTALEQNEITEQLIKMNIKTYQFYPRNTNDLIEMIHKIGEITQVETIADSLATYLQSRFEEFSHFASQYSQTNNLPSDSQHSDVSYKPKVYIEIYGNPIMSADNSSYLGQLLLYTGAENIFPELIRDYARVNPEDVVILNPDVIILTYPGITAEDVKNRRGWNSINAIQNGNIFTINDVNPDLILRASPRNIEGIERLIEVIFHDN
ncbi:MAG: ABC transporter substrate-binding protein [Candidatus Cloacimonetes bacterium]|nr:ABC transporter substrate-binding protein [Candidatus Cloacimonadota bacterium]